MQAIACEQTFLEAVPVAELNERRSFTRELEAPRPLCPLGEVVGLTRSQEIH